VGGPKSWQEDQYPSKESSVTAGSQVDLYHIRFVQCTAESPVSHQGVQCHNKESSVTGGSPVTQRGVQCHSMETRDHCHS
jgi:hypothetical protein